MTIKLIASGGLGNQLFQYAAARALSLKLGTKLVVDTRFYPETSKRGAMQFCLDRLPINAKIVHYSPWIFNAHCPTRRVWRRFVSERPSRRYVEPELRYDPRFLELRPGTIVSGHFHSEKYFSNFSDKIRAELDLSFQSGHLAKVSRQNTSRTASIHVRRGDYLSVPGFSMKDPEAFYEKAMQTIRTFVPDIEFLVFSDDIDWCKRRRVFEDCKFYEPEKRSHHIDDLFIMSQCAHHIIANSSFSWWGAWSNWHSGKVVVAPEYWFGEIKSREAGIVPDHWLVA